MKRVMMTADEFEEFKGADPSRAAEIVLAVRARAAEKSEREHGLRIPYFTPDGVELGEVTDAEFFDEGTE